MAEKKNKEWIAEQIMGVTRDRLLEELPYMNRALMRMPVTFYEQNKQQEDPGETHSPDRGTERQQEDPGKTQSPDRGTERQQEDPGKTLPPGIGTDGRLVYADTDEVILAYKEDRIRLSRTYLHMIFHCLFQHPFHYGRMDRRRWDFAADAAAEDAVLSLGISALQLDDDWQLQAKLDLMKQAVGEPFTAERIYHYLGTHDAPFDVEHAAEAASSRSNAAETTPSKETSQGMPAEKMLLHAAGLQSSKETSQGTPAEKMLLHAAGLQSSKETSRGTPAEMMPAHTADPQVSQDTPPAWAEDAALFYRDIHEPWLFNSEMMPEEVIRRGGDETGGKWRSISEGVQHDMEMHEKNQALEPGSLTQIFYLPYRKESSYTEFLKRFAKLTEDMHISSDEFDYIYYMYGLQLYGNVPLIEPLEYRETDRIRDFVIAIDTSGSCQGHVVEGFLQKTWDVMKDSGVFTGDLNLHIMQADAKVQRDDVIRSQEDFDLYMKDLEIRGSGGTDFRPVFQRVGELQRSGEFPHLQGLIYFTDGYGLFPQECPEYPAAFVFVRDQWEIPKVPAWAYQIVLNAGQIATEETHGGKIHL